MKCCICGKPAGKYGNNAQPLAEGQCCDCCNNKVIRARIAKATKLTDITTKGNFIKEEQSELNPSNKISWYEYNNRIYYIEFGVIIDNDKNHKS
jgi:hypothetical protein